MAHITGEAALIETFRQGDDIHRRTAAAQIYSTEPADVHRRDAPRRQKSSTSAFLYGMSAHRLTRELSIEYAEADSFIKTYFERYPKVQGYIESTLAFAREHGLRRGRSWVAAE